MIKIFQRSLLTLKEPKCLQQVLTKWLDFGILRQEIFFRNLKGIPMSYFLVVLITKVTLSLQDQKIILVVFGGIRKPMKCDIF